MILTVTRSGFFMVYLMREIEKSKKVLIDLFQKVAGQGQRPCRVWDKVPSFHWLIIRLPLPIIISVHQLKHFVCRAFQNNSGCLCNSIK